MDKLKAAEFVDLALEALRGLEDAIRNNDKSTINLKTEVLRQSLFNILEIVQSETNS